MQIAFKTDKFKFLVEFNDTVSAQEIISKLPIESTVQRWGDEIYFNIGLDITVQNGTTEVNVGDIAYWPKGRCICVFFGPTPMSTANKPVPASPVVIIGKTIFSPDELRGIFVGDKIIVDKEEVLHDTRIMSQREIDALVQQLRG